MISFGVILIGALVYIGQASALPENITIGGIFDISSSMDEAIFHYAVDHINQQSNLLPRSTVMGRTERVKLDDSFHTSKKVCKLLGSGITALVSPNSPNSAPQVQSICDAKKIPHIEVGMVFEDSSSINLFPHPSSLAMAYLSVVEAMDWQEYLILYEDINRLAYLQELLEKRDVKVTLRKLDVGPNKTTINYRSVFKEIKSTGHQHIVLDCSSENIHRILSHAQQVGMMTEYHSYLITNLDLHTVDLEDFKHGGTKITSLRLLASYNDILQTKKEQLQDKNFSGTPMKTQDAIIYDALLLWAKALTSLGEMKNIEVSTLDCETESFLEYGSMLINYMKLEETVGLTGRIKLNDFGFRTDFDLEIVELNNEGLRAIGSWDPMNGAQFYNQINKRDTSFQKKELIVSTILNPPFLYDVGEEGYEGYSVDLLKELSKSAKFNYTIKLVSDGKYGQYNAKSHQWSGMVGELVSQKADLVIADMVITSERAEVIDFTTPFMNTGITILYKKQIDNYTKGLFTLFTSPFGLDLWLCILAAYFIVPLVLFIIARFNLVEKENTEQGSNRSENPPQSSNGREAFTAMNSFWFILASGLAQRVDFLPRAFSTRTVAAFWWFFVVILISSYIANLVAFLNEDPQPTEREMIESVDDLARQNRVKYGAVQGGATAAFFRDSWEDVYRRIWASMNNVDDAFVQSYNEGIEKVQDEDGKYALFAESTVVDYLVNRRCELKQVGGLLDSKSYGIGLPKDSPFYEPINTALLQLKEDGVLTKLKRKWWEQKHGGGACSHMDPMTPRGPVTLDIHDMGGLFVILFVGILLACVIACGECFFVWWKKKHSEEA